MIFLPEMLSDSSRLIWLPKWVNTEVENKWVVPCGCDYLQIQSKEPTTFDMEIVNVWINVNHNYLLNIKLSLIVMSIHPISNLSKEIRKTMIIFYRGLENCWRCLRHKLSLYGYTNFKKVHNSGTPVPNFTKQMSCTATLHKYDV